MRAVKISLLSAVSILAVLVIFSSVHIFGRSSYADISGSMYPAIHTGSMVVDESVATYKKGDIITFKKPGDSYTVTHRIVAVKKDTSGNVFYQVKGDANSAPDPGLVPQSSVIGKVMFSIPYVGYFIAFLKTLPGLLLVIIIPATLIIYSQLLQIKREVSSIKDKRNKKSLNTLSRKRNGFNIHSAGKSSAKASRPLLIISVFVLFGLSASVLGITHSAYSDSTSLSGVNVITGSWPTP